MIASRHPLFHFSEEPGIKCFEPRPVRIPVRRTPGREWLNGALVWAIDAWHQPMYLFPRDCPRILVWPVDSTTQDDRRQWWGERSSRMIAYIERGWFERLSRTRIYRYAMPGDSFESLGDAGMWVSRTPVVPAGVEEIRDLRVALDDSETELLAVETFATLGALLATSLHVSAIRLRNLTA
jgi:hypothetical protein